MEWFLLSYDIECVLREHLSTDYLVQKKRIRDKCLGAGDTEINSAFVNTNVNVLYQHHRFPIQLRYATIHYYRLEMHIHYCSIIVVL